MNTRDLSLRRGSETDKKIEQLCRELHIEDSAVVIKAISLLERVVSLRAHKDTRDLVIYDKPTGAMIDILDV